MALTRFLVAASLALIATALPLEKEEWGEYDKPEPFVGKALVGNVDIIHEPYPSFLDIIISLGDKLGFNHPKKRLPRGLKKGVVNSILTNGGIPAHQTQGKEKKIPIKAGEDLDEGSVKDDDESPDVEDEKQEKNVNSGAGEDDEGDESIHEELKPSQGGIASGKGEGISRSFSAGQGKSTKQSSSGKHRSKANTRPEKGGIGVVSGVLNSIQSSDSLIAQPAQQLAPPSTMSSPNGLGAAPSTSLSGGAPASTGDGGAVDDYYYNDGDDVSTSKPRVAAYPDGYGGKAPAYKDGKQSKQRHQQYQQKHGSPKASHHDDRSLVSMSGEEDDMQEMATTETPLIIIEGTAKIVNKLRKLIIETEQILNAFQKRSRKRVKSRRGFQKANERLQSQYKRMKIFNIHLKGLNLRKYKWTLKGQDYVRRFWAEEKEFNKSIGAFRTLLSRFAFYFEEFIMEAKKAKMDKKIYAKKGENRFRSKLQNNLKQFDRYSRKIGDIIMAMRRLSSKMRDEEV